MVWRCREQILLSALTAFHLRLHQPDAAIDTARELVRQYPEISLFRFALVRIFIHAGKFQTARRALRRALQMPTATKSDEHLHMGLILVAEVRHLFYHNGPLFFLPPPATSPYRSEKTLSSSYVSFWVILMFLAFFRHARLVHLSVSPCFLPSLPSVSFREFLDANTPTKLFLVLPPALPLSIISFLDILCY